MMVLMMQCPPSPFLIQRSQSLTLGPISMRLQSRPLQLPRCPQIKSGMGAEPHDQLGDTGRHVAAIATGHLLRVLDHAAGSQDVAVAQCAGTGVSNTGKGATSGWRSLLTSPGRSSVPAAATSAWLSFGGEIMSMTIGKCGHCGHATTHESTVSKGFVADGLMGAG